MRIRPFTGVLLALLLVGAGAPALAIVSSQHIDYQTSMTPVFDRFAVPWTGELQLTLGSNGSIHGYYRPDDNHAYVPVTGGHDGQSVWLEIGSTGDATASFLHVTGKLSEGKIVGAAVDEQSQEQYSFTAHTEDGE
jgi:hypothetical protein